MKTLIMMRHAKSSWDQTNMDDFDRPLNGRGRAAAALMGNYLKRNGVEPTVVLCSTSQRTRETLSIVLEASGFAPQVMFEDSLYLASPQTILDCITKKGGTSASVMTLGHNPGTEILASQLASNIHSDDLQLLRMKYPTAGIAVFNAPIDSWQELAPRQAQLTAFVIPRKLE